METQSIWAADAMGSLLWFALAKAYYYGMPNTQDDHDKRYDAKGSGTKGSSAHATEMNCSALTTEVDGSTLATGMTCSAHASEDVPRKENSAAIRIMQIIEGVERESRPVGFLARLCYEMSSHWRVFREFLLLSSNSGWPMKCYKRAKRNLLHTNTSQGASSPLSTDNTLIDSNQGVSIPLSNKALTDKALTDKALTDKALTESMTEPDFSPDLSVDGSKVVWFIYDACIVLFMIGALTMLMLYLAHFKSENLPRVGIFDVYDGDQHALSHYLMLKRKVDATVDLLNSAEDVPFPGQPLRWKLPEDRSGMEELNAMYQYLEKASDIWVGLRRV
eukprot:gene14298-20276_t